MKRSALIAAALAVAGCQSDVSGVYVSTSSDDVLMVQLVNSKDGRVTGRVEETQISDAGQVTANSFSVEGAVDGAQLVLTPRSPIAEGGQSLTGALRGGVLALTWAGGRQTLHKSSEASVSGELQKLRFRGAQRVAAKETAAAAQNVSGVEAQVGSIADAEAQINRQLLNTQAQYATLAQAWSVRVRQAQALKARGNGVLAMDALTDAQGIASRVNGLHTSVNDGAQALSTNIAAARQQLAPIQKQCLLRPEVLKDAAFNSVCARVQVQEQKISNMIEVLKPAFAQSEAAYRRVIAHPEGA